MSLQLTKNTLLAIIVFLLFGLLLHHIIYIPKCYDSHKKIKILYKQANKWATTAEQSKSPEHANYARAYLWAIRDISSDIEFKLATLTDLQEFEQRILNLIQ